MTRTYEIHDRYGLVYRGTEHFVSVMWTYLTMPLKNAKKLLSDGNIADVEKALSSRKVTVDDQLKLLRLMITHNPESNEQASKEA